MCIFYSNIKENEMILIKYIYKQSNEKLDTSCLST